MPEEFRVWKATAEEGTKRQKIEPVSELTTKFKDKFSQKTMQRMERIRIYEEKENQQKKDTKDLHVSMKRVMDEVKKKANEEREARAKDEQREAKARKKAAKEEREAKTMEDREVKAKERADK